MIINGYHIFIGKPCKLRRWPYGPFLELEPGKIYRLTDQGNTRYNGQPCIAVLVKETAFPFRHVYCLYGSEEKFEENWSR